MGDELVPRSMLCRLVHHDTLAVILAPVGRDWLALI